MSRNYLVEVKSSEKNQNLFYGDVLDLDLESLLANPETENFNMIIVYEELIENGFVRKKNILTIYAKDYWKFKRNGKYEIKFIGDDAANEVRIFGYPKLVGCINQGQILASFDAVQNLLLLMRESRKEKQI